ncbi:ligand-binding sensor domain-containing protein [Flavobacterium psychrotrophum]|uniref:ligand-binding sensor domain-containing protein n=1 Tax=Flavobacterium psychrotrophum TaxID=2294119 RepID=UPI000E311C4A|nr:two-component regulator propeller domain-containing protein [Flavobacterium psychrotrophum]
MFKKLLAFFLCMYTLAGFSQHFYNEKFEGCKLDRFCLDCGMPKVTLPEDFTAQLAKGLDSKSLKNISGEIEVQVLIDSEGVACLLSAQNRTNIKSRKLDLQNAVNKTINWKPCVNKSGAQKSSISLLLTFKNGNISVKRRNFDNVGSANMKSTGTTNVKGRDQKDLSENWAVYTQQNSQLPWDMCRAIAIDSNDYVWIGTDNGVVKLKNNNWQLYNVKNSGLKGEMYDKNKTTTVSSIAIDKANSKWFIAGWHIYEFNNDKWTVYDSVTSPVKWARRIYIDNDNNKWFTSWDGVAKFDGKNWSAITTQNSVLPSNKTFGVFVDNKKKIWIGTEKGNICIDGSKTILFGDSDSPLSKAYIMQMYEDKNGNLWFSLYNDKKQGQGIYVLKTDGNWQNITRNRKDLFGEHSINNFLLDEKKGVLWITLSNVGVIKYTVSVDKWEVYTNENSNIPSTYIEQIAQSSDGTIWAATYAGIIKLNKKD